MSNVKSPESVILFKITVRFIWLPEAKTVRESSYDSSECEKGSKGIKTFKGPDTGAVSARGPSFLRCGLVGVNIKLQFGDIQGD